MTFELKRQSPISIGQRVDLLATEIEIPIDGMLLRKLDGGAVPRQQYPTLNRIANAEAIRRNYGWFKNEYWDQRDGRHLIPSGSGSLIQRCGYWNNKTGANRKFVVGNSNSKFASGNETSVTETNIGFSYQNIYYAPQVDRWFWQGSGTLWYSLDTTITAFTSVTSPMTSTAYSMYEVPTTGTLLASWASPNDTIARSVDGGDTWSTVSINWPAGITGQNVRQTIVDADGIIGAFAANKQLFIKSQDDGLTWSGVSGSVDVLRSINAMDVNPETNTVVMVGFSYVYRGSNGFSGAITEVSSVNLPLSSFTAYDVKFIGSDTWVVVGTSGLLWISVDDGLTFTEVQGAEYYAATNLAGILTTSDYSYTIVYDTSGNAVVRIDPGSNFMAIPQVRADTPGFNSYVRVR